MPAKASLTSEDKQEIVKRYNDGAGIVELAHAYRCRTSQINLTIRESGTPARKALTANTPIECRLHDALMAAGIGFTTQRRLVGRYVVDISVHQAPVVIEADGMRHRAGSEVQARDAIRDAAHEAAGYRVFRFSGSEINTDAGKCIGEVVNACGLVPDKEPVYDIRTKFSGADHPRYVGLYDLTCQYCGETFQSRRQRNKYCSHEHYILGAQKGKPKSAEWRAKIGEGNRGRVQSPEARAKISAARMGKPTTAGRPKSAEHRAKISASLMGRRDSDETRVKKSAASRRREGLKRSSQIVIEPELTGDRESSPETRLPATLF